MEIHNESLRLKNAAYKLRLPTSNGRETILAFHGTKLECHLSAFGPNGNLCSKSTCSVCSICHNNFKKSLSGSNITFLRFGHGIYFSVHSAKSHDYNYRSDRGGTRCLIACDVTIGRTSPTSDDMQNLQAPPSGYDSVTGVPGRSLNYPETVVYEEDAVLPRFLVFYKSDVRGSY